MPTTSSPSDRPIPRTPPAVRPMGRTSLSLKRIDLPRTLAISTSWEPSVRMAAISSSSASRLMPMMPPRRGFE